MFQIKTAWKSDTVQSFTRCYSRREDHLTCKVICSAILLKKSSELRVDKSKKEAKRKTYGIRKGLHSPTRLQSPMSVVSQDAWVSSPPREFGGTTSDAGGDGGHSGHHAATTAGALHHKGGRRRLAFVPLGLQTPPQSRLEP